MIHPSLDARMIRIWIQNKIYMILMHMFMMRGEHRLAKSAVWKGWAAMSRGSKTGGREEAVLRSTATTAWLTDDYSSSVVDGQGKHSMPWGECTVTFLFFSYVCVCVGGVCMCVLGSSYKFWHMREKYSDTFNDAILTGKIPD